MRFIFFAFTLLLASPAFAQDRPVPFGTQPVFKCEPDGFDMRKTSQGLQLTGSMTVPSEGYTHAVEPVEDSGTETARATLTVTAPPENQADATPATPVEMPISAIIPVFPTTTRLIFNIEKPPGAGPSQIDCVQVGGGQY
jgi:hypothetical protein